MPLLVALSLVLVLALAATARAAPRPAAVRSSPGEQTFRKDGAPFTFEYPSSFRKASYSGGVQVNTATSNVALALDKRNYLLVQVYKLKIAVRPDGSSTDPNGNALPTSRVDAILDHTIEGVIDLAGFSDRRAAQTGRLGSLRARVYHVAKLDGSATNTIYVALSGTTEYYVSCQSSPSGAARIASACSRLVATFAKR